MSVLPTLIVEEFREHVRNRWIVSAIVTFALLALALAGMGSLPVGQTQASPLAVTTVSLASLSVYLVPLIGLGLSFDSIVGERERGTLQLLLTYPVGRWQILLGKYFGQVTVLALAVFLGYGCAGFLHALLADEVLDGWRDYHLMMGSSVLLGASFVALGCLVSVLVRQRATAIAMVMGLWLLMVLLYDLGLVLLLFMDENQVVAAEAFSLLMTLNPADAYRTLNLAASDDVSLVSGMADAVVTHPVLLLGSLVTWALLPLTVALFALQRQEI